MPTHPNITMKRLITGHRGMVGSALVRASRDCEVVTRTREELDLGNQQHVHEFLAQERPDEVVVAAARVGGIHANDTYPAEFLYENLAIATNLIHGAYLAGVPRLLFLGSSCIYPRHAPQPMPEGCLLTGPLESTNEAYAVAKIAGITMLQAYSKQYGFNGISLIGQGYPEVTFCDAGEIVEVLFIDGFVEAIKFLIIGDNVRFGFITEHNLDRVPGSP